MADIDDFRAETRSWLEENCPAGARGPGPISTGAPTITIDHEDTELWLDRMIEKGWTAPVWPKEYGGGALDTDQYMTLIQEMRRIDARAPLGGMGVSLIGPTLLEYGTDEQKARHIPRIVRGEVAWCQGYSEPGAGSDLASLRTRAEDKGDHFVVNGQKFGPRVPSTQTGSLRSFEPIPMYPNTWELVSCSWICIRTASR